MDKYIEAKAVDNDIFERGENGGAVTALLKYLLDSNIVDGVLNVKEGNSVYDGIPTYTTNGEDLINTAGSLHCAPTMVSDLIARYLNDEKVAVTTKPCDAMAIDEVIKRHGINRDNVYMIGLNCGGTVRPTVAEEMIELFYDLDPNEVNSEEITKGNFTVELENGEEKSVKIDQLEEEGFGRRENCQRCEFKIPEKADIACGNWGASDGYTFIQINSDKGEKLVEDAEKAGYIKTKKPSEKQINIRSKIEGIMVNMSKKTQETQLFEELPEGDEIIQVLGRCLKCKRCRDICPICNCNTCRLDEDFFREDPTEKPDALILHGVRMSHMAFSCVNCGQCEDVCPMELPIAKLYQKIQLKYRESTGYKSGITDGKPPMYSGEKEEIMD